MLFFQESFAIEFLGVSRGCRRIEMGRSTFGKLRNVMNSNLSFCCEDKCAISIFCHLEHMIERERKRDRERERERASELRSAQREVKEKIWI